MGVFGNRQTDKLFDSCTLPTGKIEKNEVGGACGAYGGGERCAQGSSGETRGKEAIGMTQTQMGGQY